MENIKIAGKVYQIPAKIKGSLSNKWNRAAKLMYRFEELDQKFRGILSRGMIADTKQGRLALATLLLMHTGIRVGNEGSAEGYMTKPHPKSPKEPEFVKTYGLTTLLWEHVQTNRKKVKLNFVGKKSVENCFEITDPLLIGRIRELEYLNNVTRYFDEPEKKMVFDIAAPELTRFIKKYVGQAFSPKDFRTMRAHMYASEFISAAFSVRYERKKDLNSDLKALFVHVSGKLNNLPGTVRKSYITDLWPVVLAGRVPKARSKPRKRPK